MTTSREPSTRMKWMKIDGLFPVPASISMDQGGFCAPRMLQVSAEQPRRQKVRFLWMFCLEIVVVFYSAQKGFMQ